MRRKDWRAEGMKEGRREDRMTGERKFEEAGKGKRHKVKTGWETKEKDEE